MRVLGLDPGLRNTGWGVIEAEDNRLSHVANGVVSSNGELSLAERLLELSEGLREGGDDPPRRRRPHRR